MQYVNYIYTIIKSAQHRQAWTRGQFISLEQQAELTMYHQYSQLSTSPCQEDQRIFIAIDTEVREVGVIPQEQEVSQRFVVLLRDELQGGVGHQCAVTVEVEAIQRQARL